MHVGFVTKSKEETVLSKLIDVNEALEIKKHEVIREFSVFNRRNKFEIDDYGNYGSITPLFSAFKKLDICHIKVQDSKVCSHCCFTSYSQKKIGPLLSLQEYLLESEGIEGALKHYFSSQNWTCEECSSPSAQLPQRKVLEAPKIIFAVIDMDYDRLKAFSNYKEKIQLTKKHTYQLVAAITKPQENHFAVLLKDPKDDQYGDKNLFGW